jgi:hypothetical protein
VPDHDFLFALDLSDELHFDRMLKELSAVVLKYVGFDPRRGEAVTKELGAALAAGAAGGHQRCDVRFRAAEGALRISVTFAGGRAWEASHPLPAGS